MHQEAANLHTHTKLSSRGISVTTRQADYTRTHTGPIHTHTYTLSMIGMCFDASRFLADPYLILELCVWHVPGWHQVERRLEAVVYLATGLQHHANDRKATGLDILVHQVRLHRSALAVKCVLGRSVEVELEELELLGAAATARELHAWRVHM